MRGEKMSPAKVVAAPDGRMFLVCAAGAERELLRLHQFRKLENRNTRGRSTAPAEDLNPAEDDGLERAVARVGRGHSDRVHDL